MDSTQFKVSIVVPVYGAPESLLILHQRVVDVMRTNNWQYELILVNDACPKLSWLNVQKLCDQDKSVKGLNFSRNFGQHYAISAGLGVATGDVAIVMDCDLQDRPEEIPNLVAALGNDVDISIGRSSYRSSSSLFTTLSSKLFYKIFSFLTYSKRFSFNASFVCLSRKAYQALNRLDENQRLFVGLLQYIGFNYVFVDVEHESRQEGASSYNLFSRLSMAFRGITNSSTRLLHGGILLGTFCSLSSFLYGVYLIVSKLMFDSVVPGWTSNMVSTFFVGGIVMVLIGILGLYLEVIFWEVKNRPAYFIKEQRNLASPKLEHDPMQQHLPPYDAYANKNDGPEIDTTSIRRVPARNSDVDMT